MPVEPLCGPYALPHGAPRMGQRGLFVGVSFRPAQPRGGVPQGIIAHAHDAAGWWIGLSVDGRTVVGVGTASGPVSLPVGPSLSSGVLARVHARFPGVSGERLEVQLHLDGVEAGTAGAVIGSSIVPAPGSVVWGARGLRDRRVPQHPFSGEIGDVVMIADRAASPDDEPAEGMQARWATWVCLDADRYGALEPVAL